LPKFSRGNNAREQNRKSTPRSDVTGGVRGNFFYYYCVGREASVFICIISFKIDTAESSAAEWRRSLRFYFARARALKPSRVVEGVEEGCNKKPDFSRFFHALFEIKVTETTTKTNGEQINYA